ncbi:MAG: beta-propeller domain-containing protein [Burkholderiales bacterium]
MDASIARLARLARTRAPRGAPFAVPACVALAAALALAGCGGAAGTTDATAPPPSGEVALKLVPVDGPTLVADWRGRLEAGRPGSGGSGVHALGAPVTGLVGTPVPSSNGSADTGGASRTAVQEAGVDEDDVVRVDGEVVWAITPPASDGRQRLRAHRVQGGGARLDPAGGLDLDASLRFDGLFVDAARGRLVLVGRRGDPAIGIAGSGASGGAPVPAIASMPCCGAATAATVLWWVSNDAAAPRVLNRIELDGDPLATRVVGGRLWAVLRHVPRFAGFDWGWADPAANRRWLDGLKADAGLPGRRVDGVDRGPLVAADACLAQTGVPSTQAAITTVLAIDLDAPLAAPRARCVATAVDAVHMTAGTLVLASTRWGTPGGLVPMPAPAAVPGTVAAPLVARAGEPATDLHRFALSADAIDYRGSGSVPGTLGGSTADAARFALSVDGLWLRVLTQRDRWAAPGASPALLSVLVDRGDGTLAVAATLPNARRPEPIGKPGEQVHGVRFVGSRGYAVTFRRTDPLFVIELADPLDPRLLGALEVPGFADRLYPLGDRLLLGVGHDTVDAGGFDLRVGVLASLIDVSDPTRPVELGRRVIGGPGSRSAVDVSPHGAMVRSVGGRWRIALPVAEHAGAAATDDAWLPAAARWRAFSRLAAFRFVVDPATPALVERPAIEAPHAATVGSAPWTARDPAAMPYDRAIDVGDTGWLWADGRFVGAAW